MNDPLQLRHYYGVLMVGGLGLGLGAVALIIEYLYTKLCGQKKKADEVVVISKAGRRNSA